MQWLHVIVWRITYLTCLQNDNAEMWPMPYQKFFFSIRPKWRSQTSKRDNIATSTPTRTTTTTACQKILSRIARVPYWVKNDFLHFVQQSLKCWLQEEIFILIRASLILHCFHPQCCHLVTGVDKWSSTYKTKLEMLTPGASSRDINSVTRWIVCSFNIRPFTKTKKSTYL